ncbi:unnamed protein product [Ectocarpus sp. CCAP 1310/34]|nr:unnamed protein product [Ectocarpus sp. CCAP 1310/34]
MRWEGWYNSGHISASAEVQARIARASRRRKQANKIDLGPVNANDMGMECRRIVERVFV